MTGYTSKTRRIIILGVILMACLAVYAKQYQILGVVAGGLLGLLKSDKEED